MKKFLREASIILPIGLIGSMFLILLTYAFKAICYVIEMLSSFFETEDGFFLVIVGIVTIAYAIKWVSSTDNNQED